MLVWIIVLTLLVVLMFIVLIVLGLTILKHLESMQNIINDICNRAAFTQGMAEAIASMVRELKN